MTAIAVGLCFVAPVVAQSTVDFSISGTSTIRGWTCEVSGRAEVTSGAGEAVSAFGSGVEGVTLIVPVAEFSCPNEEMTGHLLEAMKPEEFAEITFELASYEVTGAGANATGALTILDTTQSVTIPVELVRSDDGVAIEGDVRLDMTTYGVEPPTVMLGMMRVRPQIRIEFSGVVTP